VTLQIPTEVLDPFGTTIGKLGQRRWGSVFTKVLPGLAQRLRHFRHRLGDILFAHVHTGCHLLRRLIHHRSTLAPARSITLLVRAGNFARRLLNLVDNLARRMVSTVTHRRCRLARWIS